MPMNKNMRKNDRSRTVLYPNIAMQPNITAAITKANSIVNGLFVIEINSSGVITIPINTAYKANNRPAVNGFK